MVKAQNSLLALIHQHLLQSGYCKAARELQIESGEKFSSPKVNLEKIYKKWHKKAKKRKGVKREDVQSKKPRVQDPASSSESSDNEDNTLQKEDKKHSAKKTEVKPASAAAKKMNSTKQSSAKAKSTPVKATPPVKPVALDTKAAASSSVSSDSSDSEEEVVVAPPVLATIVNPTPAAEKKNERSATSVSVEEPAKQTAPAKTAAAKTPTARKARSTAAANRKAAVRKDVSESSDDETDIEKPAKATMGANGSASKTTAVLPASQARSSQGKTRNPTIASASESSSDDSDSEEEPESQKVTPVVQATPKKRATPVSRAKAVASQAPKPEAAAVDSKPAGSGELASSGPAVKATQKISTPIRGSTKKQQPVTPFSMTPGAGKAKTPPQVSQHAADESSEADTSDSDSEPLTKAASAPLVRNSVPSTPVAAAKPSAPTSASAPDSDADSESSDSSDSEVKQPVVTTPKSATPAVAGKGKTQVSAALPPADETSSEDSDSDSDEATVTTVPAAAAPVGKALPGKGLVASKPQSADSSETSDSAETEAEPKPAAATSKSTKPVVALKEQPQPTAALTPDEESSSEDSESDDSEEPVKTPIGSQLNGTPKPKKSVVPSLPKKLMMPAASPATVAKEKITASGTTTPKSSVLNTSVKGASPALKSAGAAARGSVGGPARVVAGTQPGTAADSSGSSSDSEEEQAAAQKPLQPANQKTGTPGALTSILSKNTVAKGKSSVPAKTAPVGKLAPADDSESSDTDSEEEEEEAPKIVTPPPTTVKTKDKVTPAPKPSSGRTVKAARKSPEKPAETPASPATVGKGVPATPHLCKESSLEDSGSDSEPVKPVKAAVSIGAKKGKPQPAAKPTPMKSLSPAKTPVVAKPPSEESSDTSSSDTEEEEPVQKLELPTMQKTGAPGTLTSPPSKITAAKGKASVPTKTLPAEKLVPADVSESSDIDSDEETAQVVTPPPSTVKTKERKTTAKMAKTPTPSSAIKMPVSLAQEQSVGASKASVSPVKKTKASGSIGTKKVKPETVTTAPSPAITPLVAKPAAEESSDTSSSGSEEEEPVKKLQLPTKQKTGALLSPLSKNTAATGKASVPAKTPPVGKLAPADDSESSGTDLNEETDQVVTPATPSAVKTKDRKVTGKIAKSPIPSSMKLEKATSPIKMLVKFKQEPVDSYIEKSAVKDAKKELATTPAAVKPTQGKRARNLAKIPESSLPAAKQSKPKVVAKAPVSQAAAESSSSSSDSEEDSAEKPTIATPKSAAPANVAKVAAATPQLSKESSSEESESDSDAEPAIPAIAVASVVKGKSHSAAKPTPLKAPSPIKSPVVAKPPAVESSDATTSSDSEEEEPAQQKPTVPQKILSPVKVQKSAAGSAPATSQSQAKDSDSSDTESSDSDDAPEVQSKLSSVGILKPALKPVGKLPGVGAAVPQSPVKAVCSAANKSGSMLENSQLLLEEPASSKATPKKRKTASQVDDKLGSVAEKPVKAKKQKTESKKHVQPIAAPVPAPPAPQTTPGAMLESEEETVLALLEGRNPKKDKKGKKSSKKKTGEGPQAEALIPEQANNTGLAPSLWVPDTPNSVDQGNFKSPSAQKFAQPPAENVKSAKKRKISPEDNLAKQEAKLAKKAKKEKKEKKHKAGTEGGTATANTKSSKKDKKKSEKKKAKKKKDSKEKKPKKDKKVTSSVTGPVGESTDSGISLLSKPKKKKKVKADKDSLKTS